MKKNKILAVGACALALGSIGSVASPVAMAETETSTKETKVKYSVTETYEWNIHPEIDFGKDAGVNQAVNKNANKVSVTKNVLHEGAKLEIKVKGSGTGNAFTISNGKTEVLSYAINDGSTDLAVNGTVLEVAAGTNEGSKDLNFKLTTANKKAEIAGNYNGTVSYTASIVG